MRRLRIWLNDYGWIVLGVLYYAALVYGVYTICKSIPEHFTITITKG